MYVKVQKSIPKFWLALLTFVEICLLKFSAWSMITPRSFEINPCGGTAFAAVKINTYSCGRTAFVVFNVNPYPFISVEQGNKGQIFSGTGEQIQY